MKKPSDERRSQAEFLIGLGHASRRSFLALIVIGISLVVGSKTVRAQDQPADSKPIKHQITGLCCPEREKDLREAFAKLPKFKLMAVNYENAEVTVDYDPAKIWPGEKPERYVELFSNEIGSVSRYTFRAKPLRAKPLDKLKRIEIPVAGLDCPGCSFGAYRIIYELPGVETAAVDFKKGLVTALIDPEQTDRDTLKAALKKSGVDVETPRE